MKTVYNYMSCLVLLMLLITACGGQSPQQEATVGEVEHAMNADGTCNEGFRLFEHGLLVTDPLFFMNAWCHTRNRGSSQRAAASAS